MKINFETPDSPLQIVSLAKLLEIKNPTPEEVAMAMTLTVLIFYENRPGKLYKKTKCDISGTGCHNPTSYKTGETIMGIWRLQLYMKDIEERFSLDLSYEYVQDGYLTADFKSRGWSWSLRADIIFDDKSNEVRAEDISIIGKYHDCLMEELKNQLMPLLEIISQVQTERIELVHA